MTTPKICNAYNNQTPLIFDSKRIEDHLESLKYNLDRLIYYILYYSDEEDDYDKISLAHNCKNGCARSVIDIYRHVKAHNPKIKIQDVMRKMYEMQEKNNLFVGRVCNTIERRVFRLEEQEEDGGSFYDNKEDEFNLYFEDWKEVK